MLPAFGDSAGESLTFSLSQLINIPAKISENHQINLSFMSGGGERDMKKYISLIQPVYTSHVLPGVSFTRHLFFTLPSLPSHSPHVTPSCSRRVFVQPVLVSFRLYVSCMGRAGSCLIICDGRLSVLWRDWLLVSRKLHIQTLVTFSVTRHKCIPDTQSIK